MTGKAGVFLEPEFSLRYLSVLPHMVLKANNRLPRLTGKTSQDSGPPEIQVWTSPPNTGSQLRGAVRARNHDFWE